MKAVVVTAPHQFEIREVPIPELKSQQDVLIQMKAAGVCGSDLHIYHGKNPCATYPRIPGHENAGIVAAVGKEVTNVKVGDHVIIDLVSACGTCYQCGIGRKNVCSQVRVRGSGADGGWKEYIAAPAREVYKISKDVDWMDAALVEPYAIGAHCTARGRVVPGDRVLILGAGTIGTIIFQTCRNLGCKTIICCDVDDAALRRARECGADAVINTKEEKLGQRIAELTEGAGVTIAFDAACFPGSMAMCLQPGIIGNAGRLVPMGFSTEYESISQAMINQRELDIIGSRMSAFQFENTIKKMEQGAFMTKDIAAAGIPFGEIERVFQLMDHPVSEAKKTVILF